MVRRGKHLKRSFTSRKVPVMLILLAVSTAAIGGTAFAAVRYEQSASKRILPGVKIAGIDVGGLSRAEALRAVRDATTTELERDLVVTVGDKEYNLSRAELGVRASASTAVRKAMGADDALSFFSRILYRVTGRSVNEALKVPTTSTSGAIRGFLDEVAQAVTVEPTDATITGASGKLEFEKSSSGQALDVPKALESLRAAMRGERGSVALPVRSVRPAVTPKDLGLTIVVNRSNNMLYLYRGFDVWKRYPVATAAPGYETPPGDWQIINKRVNPTWVNPAPDTWGADLPRVIPPGPNNPLGPRSLDLNASGIRIHGTYDAQSVGTYASHGCIRMYVADSKELFSLVPVGTKVVII